MKHLTVDEIIDFVSLTELNSKAIALSASVNGHICKCRKCLKLVRSFQMVYDEFAGINAKAYKQKTVCDFLAEKAENQMSKEMGCAAQLLDGYK